MTLLAVDNVTCEYRTRGGIVRAVAGVSLHVQRGETLAIVGESGCGKSTLAKLVLGLAPISSGRIVFAGEDTATMDRAGRRNFRRHVQAVFQDPYSSLNPRLRVERILAEPMQAHGSGRAAVRARVEEVLALVGLPRDAARLYPHEFSGGQRQRIAIARALTLQPSLIVLDEPISALDVSIRAQILNLLQDIQDELGLAYLLIAHDLALVAHASRRAAVMYLGRIVEIGDTDTLFGTPQHPYTQALLRAVLLPDPGIRRARDLIKGEIASALSPPSGCHFHPRCPHALDACRTQVPPLVARGSVSAACWLAAPPSAAPGQA